MSLPSTHGDVPIDLRCTIRGLEERISGPSAEATELLRYITAWPGPSDSSPTPTSTSFEFVPHSPPPNLPIESGSGFRTRAAIEADFPHCPAAWLCQARKLGGGVQTGEERVLRAWKAGCWALAVLRDQCSSPNHSPKIDHRPRVYAVIRATGLEGPTLFFSARSYFRAVGDLKTSSSISHGFPSELEAATYTQCSRHLVLCKGAMTGDGDLVEELAEPLTADRLVSVATEVEPYCFVSGSLQDLDGQSATGALVVMKRRAGLLLALPLGALSEEALEDGNRGDEGSTFGPSTVVPVPGVIIDGGQVQSVGVDISVVIIDCRNSVVSYLREFRPFENIDYGFLEDNPYVLPSPDGLLSAAIGWIEATEQERVAFYSADSETPTGDQGPQQKRKPAGKATPTGGGAKPGEKAKKPTTATLAASLEEIMKTLPQLTVQVADINQRQTAFEERISEQMLSRPLSSTLDLGSTPKVAASARTMKPPPRTAGEGGLGLLTPQKHFGPQAVQELELEKKEGAEAFNQHGPNGGPHCSFRCQHSRSCWSCKTTGGVSTSSGHFLYSSSPKHVETHESFHPCRFHTCGVSSERHFWSSPSGTFWWLCKATGVWNAAVPGDVHLRPLDGGGLWCCQGCCGFAGGLPGADRNGQWQNGGRCSVEPSRRCAQCSVHQSGQPCYIPVESLLPEGDGCDHGEAPGVCSWRPSYRWWCRSGSSGEETAKTRRKRQRTRKESTKARRGGAVAAPGNELDVSSAEVEGQESNPLTVAVSFDDWLAFFPRWICKSSCMEFEDVFFSGVVQGLCTYHDFSIASSSPRVFQQQWPQLITCSTQEDHQAALS